MVMVLTSLRGIPLVQPGDSLPQLILDAMDREHIQLADGDILVVAQKIISKAENRLRNLVDVTPSPRAVEIAAQIEKDARLVELILQESRQVLRLRPGVIIVEHQLGFVCANAGIDHSNVCGAGSTEEEYVLLLPENPDHSAATLREVVQTATGAQIGVLVIDSHGRAWRNGTVGVSIGIAGLPGLVDLRGKLDMLGYEMRVTQVGAADELAAAASLVMGQADEKTPVVHVRGFPYPLREGKLAELIRPEEQDLFR